METTQLLRPVHLLGLAGILATAGIHGAVQCGAGASQRVGRWCICGDVQLCGPWPHTLFVATREGAPSGPCVSQALGEVVSPEGWRT